MAFIRYNITEELKKTAQGKKSKTDVGVLLCVALEKYPAAQARIARAFGIKA